MWRRTQAGGVCSITRRRACASGQTIRRVRPAAFRFFMARRGRRITELMSAEKGKRGLARNGSRISQIRHPKQLQKEPEGQNNQEQVGLVGYVEHEFWIAVPLPEPFDFDRVEIPLTRDGLIGQKLLDPFRLQTQKLR